MTEMSSTYSYNAARGLRGTRIILGGATYQNRDWIKSANGTFDGRTKAWSLPMPSSNKMASTLLYEIVKRGMQWAAK